MKIAFQVIRRSAQEWARRRSGTIIKRNIRYDTDSFQEETTGILTTHVDRFALDTLNYDVIVIPALWNFPRHFYPNK